MTIHDLRKQLADWGRMAASMRTGQGWGRVSQVAKMEELCAGVGGRTGGTGYEYDTELPGWFVHIDEAIASLGYPQEREALQIWYARGVRKAIKRKEMDKRHREQLERAEWSVWAVLNKPAK